MMRSRIILWLVMAMAVTASMSAAATTTVARSESRRELISAGWEYLQNNTPDPQQATRATNWQPVNLPHTWNAFDATDTVPGYRRDASWYRKTLSVTPDGLRHALLFTAANMKAEVYVNGVRVGAHVGGYLPFEIDVTNTLRKGANIVLVRVDNGIDRELIPSAKSDFTIYGGLTRDVFLLTRPPTYIASLAIDTPQVSVQAAATRITTTLANFGRNQNATVVALLRDSNGNEVARATQAVALAAGQTQVGVDLPMLTQPRLWSTRVPTLYTAEVTLVAVDGRVLHRASERYGYRWFEIKPHGAFYLNGERLLIRGTHRHEERAGYGGALPAALQREDVVRAKEMGANFLRLGHYPQDAEVYRTADELGLLIWDELPWCRGGLGNAAWQANTERLLREQIVYNRNHPSIIIWSLGNELDWLPDFDGISNPDSINVYLKHLNAVAKQLDPGRYTAQRRYYEGADIVDVFSPSMWPGWYQSGYAQYEATIRAAQAKYPRLLHMEYGADSHVGRHLNTVRDGTPPPAGARSIALDGDWDETYAVDLFDWYLHISEGLDNYPGSAQWALQDFATPLRPDNPIPYVNQKGLLDRAGQPKEAYWVFKSYWTEPVGAAAFCHIYGHSWTERYGEAGQPRQVRVYCNTSQARLIHNGVDLGMRTRDIAKFPAAGLTWDVTFIAGENQLEVIGLTSGQRVASDTLRIDYRIGGHGPRTEFRLTATPREDGLVRIDVLAIDAKGRTVLDSRERVYFSADGGELLANYGTPDRSSTIELANGHAAILYRPQPGRSGVVGVLSQDFQGRSITVSSPKSRVHSSVVPP